MKPIIPSLRRQKLIVLCLAFALAACDSYFADRLPLAAQVFPVRNSDQETRSRPDEGALPPRDASVELEPESLPEPEQDAEPETESEGEPESLPEPESLLEPEPVAEPTYLTSDTTIITGSGPGDARCLTLPSDALGFGSLTQNDWAQWLGSARFARGTEHLELPGEVDGRRTLRQRFVPTDNGTPRVVTGVDLPAARTYRLVQSVFFEPGWDWGGERRQGGKIGFGFSGGTAPSGGTVDTAGFSARIAWRGNLDGTARMSVYSYAADRPGRFGEEVFLGEFLAPIGQWFDLALEIQSNSNIQATDGRMRAWVGGILKLDRVGVAWQTSGAAPVVDNLYYSTFYGGNSPDWSPDHTTYSQVRDVCWAAVVDGYSGIDPEAGRLSAPSATELDRFKIGTSNDRASLYEAEQDLRGRVEALAFTVGSMLEGDLELVQVELRDIQVHLRLASTASYWLGASAPDLTKPSFMHIDQAIAFMLDAIDNLSGLNEAALVEYELAAELVKLAFDIVDSALAQAQELPTVYGCTTKAVQGCGSAAQAVSDARTARELMDLYRNDTRQLLPFLQATWNAAGRVVASLH